MTKAKIIGEILQDMYTRSGATKAEVDKRWSGWLKRQPKAELETIMKNRGLYQ